MDKKKAEKERKELNKRILKDTFKSNNSNTIIERRIAI